MIYVTTKKPKENIRILHAFINHQSSMKMNNIQLWPPSKVEIHNYIFEKKLFPKLFFSYCQVGCFG